MELPTAELWGSFILWEFVVIFVAFLRKLGDNFRSQMRQVESGRVSDINAKAKDTGNSYTDWKNMDFQRELCIILSRMLRAISHLPLMFM